MDDIKIYRCKDVYELMQWRRATISAVFGQAPDKELDTATMKYYVRHLRDGSHVPCIAYLNCRQVGCASLCIYDEMPSPDNLTGRCGYVMSVYVLPEFRDKGVGTAMLKWLLDMARKRGCGRVWLESTIDAHDLYASLGFSDALGVMNINLEKSNDDHE